MNGTYADLTLTPTYSLSATAYSQLITEYIREDTAASYLTDQLYRVALGYHQELKGGITFGLQPEFQINPFQSANPFFDVIRLDRVYRMGVSIYNRKWQFRGFCPTLNYTFTDNRSNIGLYEYKRSQIQIGMTKEF
jgi:hypothetical protein